MLNFHSLLMTGSLHISTTLSIALVLISFLLLSKTFSFVYILVVTELFWILLYTKTLVSAILIDSLTHLSLCFFFLMFSASEMSIGLFVYLSMLGLLLTPSMLHTSTDSKSL